MEEFRITNTVSVKDWLHRNNDLPEAKILICAVENNLITYEQICDIFLDAFGVEVGTESRIAIDETSLRDYIRYELVLPDDFYLLKY